MAPFVEVEFEDGQCLETRLVLSASGVEILDVRPELELVQPEESA